MASGNPALNDAIFQREIAQNSAGSSPASELPPGIFGGQPGSGASTLPPPPGLGTEQTTWGPPPTSPPSGSAGSGDTMRLGGTMSASAILLGFLVVAAYFGWQAVTVTTVLTDSGTRSTASVAPWVFLMVFVGLGLAILTIVKPKIARFSAPAYAVAEGIFIGAISRFYEVSFTGIVLQAVGLTIGVFVMMLVLYATGTIKVTDKLRRGIFAATGAVAIVYLATFVLRLFSSDIPYIHNSGPIGILFSLVVVGIAASNLLLDFDFIERGVKMGAPRYMEWFGAFGLILTLVWLYLELLRLLSKLRSN